jgi:hypothetical protein
MLDKRKPLRFNYHRCRFMAFSAAIAESLGLSTWCKRYLDFGGTCANVGCVPL